MSQKITCPHCKKEFPMEQGLESHFNDLKQSVINETKKQEQNRIQKLENEKKIKKKKIKNQRHKLKKMIQRNLKQ